MTLMFIGLAVNLDEKSTDRIKQAQDYNHYTTSIKSVKTLAFTPKSALIILRSCPLSGKNLSISGITKRGCRIINHTKIRITCYAKSIDKHKVPKYDTPDFRIMKF